MKIEEKAGEKAMDKIKLPLLSKKSIYAMTKDELKLLEDDVPQPSLNVRGDKSWSSTIKGASAKVNKNPLGF